MNMKRLNIFLLMMAAISMTAIAGYPEGYYDQMDGKMKETLKAAAKQCVQKHVRLDYYELPNYWQYSDVYPELINGNKRWWEMYSNQTLLIYPYQSGTQAFSANKMQREHAIPKSWWKKANGDIEYTPAYTDMWNLYPSEAAANQAKSNYPFGETRTTSFNNGVTKVGAPKTGYGGGSASVFEPGDEYKGDFARTIFYMATVYDDLNWVYRYMFVNNSYPSLQQWSIDMLLDWARKDPVSQKEIDRNNIVEQYQGNRNPFIDFPNLAEYIWGRSMNDVFYLADQEDSDPIPPITGNPEITEPINGESLDFGQTAVGHSVNRALHIKGSNMTEPLSLRVVGANSSYFKLETEKIPGLTINQYGDYLLNITYLPETTGTHTAKLSIYDGGLEGTIVVDLRGESLDVPEMKALNALAATDVTENGYTANWNAANGIADYYVVRRVRYGAEGEELETYETGETYYRFDDRDPEVAESYTVTYVRLGIESPASNSIYVAASGINDIREESPCHVYGIEGGILVSRADGETGRISIFTADGYKVIEETDAEDGAFYTMDRGVYIVTVGGGKPVKIMVK